MVPVQCCGKKKAPKAAKTKIEIFTSQEQRLGLQEVHTLSVYFSNPDENPFFGLIGSYKVSPLFSFPDSLTHSLTAT